MNKKTIRHSFYLLITSTVWGFAFVAQKVGGTTFGPYLFNFLRFLIGSLVLLPVIAIKHKVSKDERKPKNKQERNRLIIASILCGTALCVASNFQQYGMYLGAGTGKAGFLTACYILIVPILGIFLKKKCPWTVWLALVIAICGLFLLCIKPEEGFAIGRAEVFELICAFCFSVQILLVDHFADSVDGVRLSCLQFFFAGLLSAVPTFLLDFHCDITQASQILTIITHSDALIALLYAGIMSCGVAYTFQIIGQEGLNPSIASLIMSLESVFSAVGGWLILHEKLTYKEIIGCVLMFVAICIAQIDFKALKSGKHD